MSLSPAEHRRQEILRDILMESSDSSIEASPEQMKATLKPKTPSEVNSSEELQFHQIPSTAQNSHDQSQRSSAQPKELANADIADLQNESLVETLEQAITQTRQQPVPRPLSVHHPTAAKNEKKRRASSCGVRLYDHAMRQQLRLIEVAKTEQQRVVADSMKNCTFQPQISKGSKKIKPHRSQSSQREMLERNKRLKREKMIEERKECTFRPNVNQLSQSIVKSQQGSAAEMPIERRLYADFYRRELNDNMRQKMLKKMEASKRVGGEKQMTSSEWERMVSRHDMWVMRRENNLQQLRRDIEEADCPPQETHVSLKRVVDRLTSHPTSKIDPALLTETSEFRPHISELSSYLAQQGKATRLAAWFQFFDAESTGIILPRDLLCICEKHQIEKSAFVKALSLPNLENSSTITSHDFCLGLLKFEKEFGPQIWSKKPEEVIRVEEEPEHVPEISTKSKELAKGRYDNAVCVHEALFSVAKRKQDGERAKEKAIEEEQKMKAEELRKENLKAKKRPSSAKQEFRSAEEPRAPLQDVSNHKDASDDILLQIESAMKGDLLQVAPTSSECPMKHKVKAVHHDMFGITLEARRKSSSQHGLAAHLEEKKRLRKLGRNLARQMMQDF